MHMPSLMILVLCLVLIQFQSPAPVLVPVPACVLGLGVVLSVCCGIEFGSGCGLELSECGSSSVYQMSVRLSYSELWGIFRMKEPYFAAAHTFTLTGGRGTPLSPPSNPGSVVVPRVVGC